MVKVDSIHWNLKLFTPWNLLLLFTIFVTLMQLLSAISMAFVTSIVPIRLTSYLWERQEAAIDGYTETTPKIDDGKDMASIGAYCSVENRRYQFRQLDRIINTKFI